MNYMRYSVLVLVLLLIVQLSVLSIVGTISVKPMETSSTNDSSKWTFLDSSWYSVDVVGEEIGVLEGQSFAGWYTDTVVVDNESGTIIVAWARWDADIYNNDYIYMAFLKPVDADGDGSPEAYQKIIKYIDKTYSLKSLDSLTIGKINGAKYVLLTWTYYDSTYKNNVKGALLDMDGNIVWIGNIRSTTSYEEYSRSCYVPAYNSGNGGFLIVWFTSYDDSVDGKWLYYDTTNGWTLSLRFDIASTNNLYYTKADQMLCIGGNDKALVVYRYWDDVERLPDLNASLVGIDNSVQAVRLYDFNGSEETIGVRGAYTSGYFIVPIVSGSYLRYDIVSETDGTVIHRDYVTSNGEHPYAIALDDRFVLVWIDHYNDVDGEPKIANIDLTNFYIHPRYGVSITGGDSNYDKHPLISHDGKNLIYIWSSGPDLSSLDIKYANITLGAPTDDPIVSEIKTLVSATNNQVAHGLGVADINEYVVVYKDLSDGEEDLLAYVVLPDTDTVSNITLYFLPRDADKYKELILNLIDTATTSIDVAVAFFNEENLGEPGSISYALVQAASRGVSVRVIMDNDTDNEPVKTYLAENGVQVIDDSSADDPYHIMHDKFMIVDGSKLIVSTLNFIISDFYKNNNTAIYIESKTISYFYEKEFEQMWNNGNGLFGTQKTDDYSFIAFTTYDTRTIVFEGYFSPQPWGIPGRIPETIAGFINRTSTEADFAAFIFSTSYWVKPVYTALSNMSTAGKTVIGVFCEELNADSPGKRIYWFIADKVPFAIDNHPYIMHAKLFVVDNTTSILGSWNPTGSATTNHDENILVIRDPDTINGYAEKISEYIREMYYSPLFVKSPYQYDPVHPVITKVMFYPDTSGDPDLEWVEIYNPTSETINLTHFVIGDAENLIEGDSDPDDGLYVFPDNTLIQPNSYIVIAYNATAFEQKYGYKPNFEIVDSDPTVPDMIRYDTYFAVDKFPGSWNLSDTGDEVILGIDRDGFISVVDAVWYGNSSYMSLYTSDSPPSTASPLDITGISPGQGIIDKKEIGTSQYYDAIIMSDKYEIIASPKPVPENPSLIIIGIVVSLIAVFVIIAKKNKKK